MTAVTKKSIGIFIYPLNVIFMPNLSSLGCLAAELESVTRDAAGRTPPVENRANPGFASLVLGPELSNICVCPIEEVSVKCLLKIFAKIKLDSAQLQLVAQLRP